MPTLTNRRSQVGHRSPGFYEALHAKLLEAQVVADDELAELARTRARAIVATLGQSGAVDAGRLRVLDPAPVKRKKAGSMRIASEMTMTAP